MPLYTRHPTEMVEAIQWFPGLCFVGLADEAPGHPGGGGLLPSPPHAYLSTRRGWLTVFVGDWVITEPTGEMHICQDGLFQRNYLRVLAEDSDSQTILGGSR